MPYSPSPTGPICMETPRNSFQDKEWRFLLHELPISRIPRPPNATKIVKCDSLLPCPGPEALLLIFVPRGPCKRREDPSHGMPAVARPDYGPSAC